MFLQKVGLVDGGGDEFGEIDLATVVHVDEFENSVDFLFGFVFAINIGEPLQQLVVLQVAVLVHV